MTLDDIKNIKKLELLIKNMNSVIDRLNKKIKDIENTIDQKQPDKENYD